MLLSLFSLTRDPSIIFHGLFNLNSSTRYLLLLQMRFAPSIPPSSSDLSIAVSLFCRGRPGSPLLTSRWRFLRQRSLYVLSQGHCRSVITVISLSLSLNFGWIGNLTMFSWFVGILFWFSSAVRRFRVVDVGWWFFTVCFVYDLMQRFYFCCSSFSCFHCFRGLGTWPEFFKWWRLEFELLTKETLILLSWQSLLRLLPLRWYPLRCFMFSYRSCSSNGYMAWFYFAKSLADSTRFSVNGNWNTIMLACYSQLMVNSNTKGEDKTIMLQWINENWN